MESGSTGQAAMTRLRPWSARGPGGQSALSVTADGAKEWLESAELPVPLVPRSVVVSSTGGVSGGQTSRDSSSVRWGTDHSPDHALKERFADAA